MRKITLLLIITILLLAACAPPAAVPTATSLPNIETQQLNIAMAPSDTPEPPGRVIYDFQELFCQATWTNNGQNLVCPSDLYEENENGFISLANEVYMEGTLLERDSALMTRPSVNGSFYGIFGAYPPIHIQMGDQFRATIGCMDDAQTNNSCDVKFALEYYDTNGNYIGSEQTGWSWNETNDGHLTDINLDLSSLAGESVRFTLVVRDNGDPIGDYALWLHPQLWRTN